MKQETYLKLYRRAAKAAPALEWTNRLITWGVYAWFTGWMIWLFLFYRQAFWPAFFTMGVSFVLVSVFRRIFNAPRPYEVFSMPPLMRKDTRPVVSQPSCVFNFYYCCGYLLAVPSAGSDFVCGRCGACVCAYGYRRAFFTGCYSGRCLWPGDGICRYGVAAAAFLRWKGLGKQNEQGCSK